MATPEAKCTLWSSHKILCRRDPTAFYLPPLRPDQIQMLREYQDEPLRQGQRLTEEVAAGKFEGPGLWRLMDEYFALVGVEGPLDNRNLEHERLLAVLAANEFVELARQAKLRKAGIMHDAAAAPPTPWEVLGRLGNVLVDEYFIAIQAMGRHPEAEAALNRAGRGLFSTLNGALRQELVSATVTAQLLSSVYLKGPKPTLSVAELTLLQRKSQRAVLDELDRADLPPSVREHLKIKYCEAVDRHATVDLGITLSEELRSRR